MPYDDQYYPVVTENDLSDDGSLKRSTTDDIKRLDKHYEKFNKKIYYDQSRDDRSYKTVAIKNYGSGQMGSRIRNAVTGQYTPYLVGSVDEDLFFVVSNCMARSGRKEPMHLFYDSPEQYENHHFTTVSQQIKQKWAAKNLLARQQLGQEQE